ncbi:MAG: 3-hydroxyanthranilate 3,4-dioxygenase [Acidimicrobiales bacterium]|nr:3-hydroxyanthranilate 3,4-dioxygenase [Acidimicrobiales bacterium]
MTPDPSPGDQSPVGIPFALMGWIAEHADEFEPPVSNKVVWPGSDFIFMVVRGPNARNDFHVDPYDEIFLQLRGAIRVDIVDDTGRRRERIVREGEVMLVPGGTPHAPIRPPDTWGLVVERPRAADDIDRLQWYCATCGALLHEAQFHVADIEVALNAAIEAVNSDEGLRTCGTCGDVLPVPSTPAPI